MSALVALRLALVVPFLPSQRCVSLGACPLKSVSSNWSSKAVNPMSVLCWNMEVPSVVTMAFLTYQMKDDLRGGNHG